MINVGCCGFPASRGAYFSRFATVEISSAFYNLPKLSTAQRWRTEAPEGFEFSLKAWQLITHTPESPTYGKTRLKDKSALKRVGHFRETAQVWEAWEKVAELAEALSARFVIFQTPPSFYPNADHLRDMYRFFKKIRRRKSVLVWEPRGSWADTLVRKVCEDLGLAHGVDPLVRPPQTKGPRYFRLHGRAEGRHVQHAHEYSDQELKALLGCCQETSYVYFNNLSMWRDAQRFKEIISPAWRPRRIPPCAA